MKILYTYQQRRAFPNAPQTVPDSMLSEDWALHVHGQSLATLNSRGGLGPAEIVGNVRRMQYRDYGTLNDDDCIETVKELLAEHQKALIT